ncbi:MAG: FG-GAP repeat domain-containing protein [Prosthecobacter sp.]|uniref:FG-GAP repeat domain-containing protein n=1 Tax=Prosthecobacter sp. TaxID=1965333 RepID=UPI0038FDE1C9
MAAFVTLTVALANAVPKFERRAFALSQAVWGVGAADVNGDGKRDLLAAADTQAVALIAPDWQPVLLGDFVAGRLLHATVLDGNRDGRLDFVVARMLSPWVEFRKAKAAGKSPPEPKGPDFTLAWIENTGRVGEAQPLHVLETDFSHIHGVAVGDVNGDGLTDLVAGSFDGPEANSIALHLATKDAPGFIGSRITRGGANGRAHYLDIDDVNGDGRADVLLAASAGNNVNAWLQNADGTWKPQLIATEMGATHAKSADVDGDGVQDIIVSNGHGKGIFWFRGPQWERRIVDGDITEAHALDRADLDGDEDIDIAAASYGEKIVVWYENDAHGNFTRRVIEHGHEQESYDLKITDLDGDGRSDFILAGRRSNNAVFYRQLPASKDSKP